MLYSHCPSDHKNSSSSNPEKTSMACNLISVKSFCFYRQSFVYSPHYCKFFVCWLLVLTNWLANVTESYVTMLPNSHLDRRITWSASAFISRESRTSPFSSCKHGHLKCSTVNFKVPKKVCWSFCAWSRVWA